jgi:hypothetical protein
MAGGGGPRRAARSSSDPKAHPGAGREPIAGTPGWGRRRRAPLSRSDSFQGPLRSARAGPAQGLSDRSAQPCSPPKLELKLNLAAKESLEGGEGSLVKGRKAVMGWVFSHAVWR